MLTSEIQRLKSTLGLLREGQGFLKVQVAEEWHQRTVWQHPQDLSLAKQELWVKKPWPTRDWPPSPVGQASVLISAGQVSGVGHRDLPPCMHGETVTWLPRPEEHLSRNITGVTWEESSEVRQVRSALDVPVLLMMQDLETPDFASPSPSRLNPDLGWTGMAVGPQPGTLP